MEIPALLTFFLGKKQTKNRWGRKTILFTVMSVREG
jgi:hypothetical protein